VLTRLKNQPYFLFLLTGVILIITTAFTFKQTLDFHLDDTLFVVSANYFIWALVIASFIAWAIYKLTYKFLWTQKLTWTHVLSTIFVLMLLATIGFWHDIRLPTIKRSTISFQNIVDDQKRESVIVFVIVAIFLLGQIAYLVNLIVGLSKRKL
jgi:hypothetical protein